MLRKLKKGLQSMLRVAEIIEPRVEPVGEKEPR